MVLIKDNRSIESRVRIILDQIESRMGLGEEIMMAAQVPPEFWLLGRQKVACLEPLKEPDAGQPNSRTLKGMFYVAAGNDLQMPSDLNFFFSAHKRNFSNPEATFPALPAHK